MRVNLLLFSILAFSIGCSTQSEIEHQIEPAVADEFSFAPWMERLGVHSVAEIASQKQVRTSIDLSGTDIAGDDLRQLKSFDRIESLNLSSTNLTDAAVPHILSFSTLRDLDLVFTRITGEGIRELGAHTNLTTLEVWHDQLDENGLAGLRDMKGLKQVVLWVPDFENEDELLPPKIKQIRPDVDVEVMWYVDPMHGL